jgi:hypothetical protein
MPIRQYLDGERFDPETTRLLGLAFEFTVQALHSAIHLTDGIAIQTCVGRGQSVIRVLRQVADPVGRSRGPGRPWLWRLK